MERGQVQIRYEKEILHCEGYEALEEVSQRRYGCCLPGDVPGQVECSFEEPGPVEGICRCPGPALKLYHMFESSDLLLKNIQQINPVHLGFCLSSFSKLNALIGNNNSLQLECLSGRHISLHLHSHIKVGLFIFLSEQIFISNQKRQLFRLSILQ